MNFWKIFSLVTLSVLAWREFGQFKKPAIVEAQAPQRQWFVEPGTIDIPLSAGGNALGKVMIDLNSGEVYGFPVRGPKLPYPGYDIAEGSPLVSRAQYLGRFDVNVSTPSRRR